MHVRGLCTPKTPCSRRSKTPAPGSSSGCLGSECLPRHTLSQRTSNSEGRQFHRRLRAPKVKTMRAGQKVNALKSSGNLFLKQQRRYATSLMDGVTAVKWGGSGSLIFGSLLNLSIEFPGILAYAEDADEFVRLSCRDRTGWRRDEWAYSPLFICGKFLGFRGISPGFEAESGWPCTRWPR